MSNADEGAPSGRRYTLLIREEDGMLWAEVEDLPGCFASGSHMDELLEAAAEAIGLYLAEPAAAAPADIHYAIQKAEISL